MNTTNRPKQTNSKPAYSKDRIIKKLQLLQPGLYHDLTRPPYLTDLGDLEKVIEFVQSRSFDGYPYLWLAYDDRKDFELEFTILAILLYDPDWLQFDVFIIRKGLREALAEVCEISGSAMSDRLKGMKGYYEVDKIFRVMSNKNLEGFKLWYEERYK